MIGREFYLKVWDQGDQEPGRDVVEMVESTFFRDEAGAPIRFTHVYFFEGVWTWRAMIFGKWTHLMWDDVVRRFGPVRAVLNKETR